MEKKIISSKKGYSLVEVVAALAIMAILFVGVTQLIASAKKTEENTNSSITNATVLDSTSNILFNLDRKGIELFLNKEINLEVTGADDISDMILNGFNEPEAIKSSAEGTYYSNASSENNKIKFIVSISIQKLKEDPNNSSNILYNGKIKVIGLKKPVQFFYKKGKKEGQGKGITDFRNNKETTINEENIILRPIS